MQNLISHSASPMSPPRGGPYLARRRRFEWLLVAVLAPLTLPLCALIAAAIRIDSRGPAVFRQRRPGIGDSTFTILKFRTMYVQEGGSGATAADDVRITRLGRVMRRVHLDEIPQLWNVLRGEMSLIGPRPEPMSNTELYEIAVDGFGLRRSVLPGITGWAQINLGYTDSIPGARKKLEYDLFYIRNASVRMDAKILLRTLQDLFIRRLSR